MIRVGSRVQVVAGAQLIADSDGHEPTLDLVGMVGTVKWIEDLAGVHWAEDNPPIIVVSLDCDSSDLWRAYEHELEEIAEDLDPAEEIERCLEVLR